MLVLNVAYPLAPVGPDAVGGAEQVLSHLDAALVRAGHRSIVVACEGSTAAGTLVATPRVERVLEDHMQAPVQARHRAAVASVLARWPVDVVHMHGLDFHAYLPPPGVPVLVTLHLPPGWYAPEAFRLERSHTYLHCVSAAQRRGCPPEAEHRLLPEIENGVPVEDLQVRHAKRGYVMALGRVCWDKGFHLALDAARRAGVACLLAGEVHAYAWHREYFERWIVPRLDARRRFIGPVGFDRKRRLLTAARALLVTSQVPETSSLVAMEALACGTPVVAFRCGALPDIVDHGRTGFLVDGPEEMADAIDAAAELDPDVCRRAARERFSLQRVTQQYFDTYHRLARTRDRSDTEAPYAA